MSGSCSPCKHTYVRFTSSAEHQVISTLVVANPNATNNFGVHLYHNIFEPQVMYPTVGGWLSRKDNERFLFSLQAYLCRFTSSAEHQVISTLVVANPNATNNFGVHIYHNIFEPQVDAQV